MKKNIVLAFALSFAVCAHARELQLLAGTQFTAPEVNGTANVGGPQVGDIIFDSSTSSFSGYGGTGPGWLTLGSNGTTLRAPTIQKFTTGSGTYSTPSGALYIRVRMVGGGGGAAGSGTSASTGMTDGTSSTFGTSLLSAGNGHHGAFAGAGGLGGTSSLGTGPVGTALAGAGGSVAAGGTLTIPFGGIAGASSAFGGGGAGTGASTGGDGISNTGGGGGAPSNNNTLNAATGSPGGAGAFIDAIITSPLTSYSYSVGSGGSGGTSGSSGFAGGAGGSGYIEVTEYYQ